MRPESAVWQENKAWVVVDTETRQAECLADSHPPCRVCNRRVEAAHEVARSLIRDGARPAESGAERRAWGTRHWERTTSRRNDVGYGQSAGESAELEAVASGQDEELREGGVRSRGTSYRVRTVTRTSGWHCFT